MASHEETRRELEVEVDTDQVEGPYDVHDNERGSEDLELNGPIERFLGGTRTAARFSDSYLTESASINSTSSTTIVTPFLEEKAKAWWKDVSPVLTLNGPVTWDRFRLAFLKHYFSPTLAARKLREFTMLKEKPGMLFEAPCDVETDMQRLASTGTTDKGKSAVPSARR
ncbi:hypothetical protein ACH5RR_008640 [Cinchona calisaya]|uniref:Retrotransposon gag domain-containing protein n=1 Tax=Cinchona calisaya TaxID=153742 RepID=A0ABD3ACM9_9GENT